MPNPKTEKQSIKMEEQSLQIEEQELKMEILDEPNIPLIKKLKTENLEYPEFFNGSAIKLEEVNIKSENDYENKDDSRLSKNLSNETCKKLRDKRKFSKKKSTNEYRCEECNYKTTYKSNFKRHQYQHKGISKADKYKCTMCEYKTIYKTHLTRHVRGHEKIVELLKCNDCEYQTFKKNALTRHLVGHRNPKGLLMCNQCDFQTIYKKSIEMHLFVHKRPEELEIYQCNDCSYQTIYKTYLLAHLRRGHRHVHVGLAQNLQNETSKHNPQIVRIFNANKHSLSQHKFSKSVLCNFCNFQTIHESVLKKHLRFHKLPKEDEMLKCNNCGFQTLWKINLVEHLQFCVRSSEDAAPES